MRWRRKVTSTEPEKVMRFSDKVALYSVFGAALLGAALLCFVDPSDDLSPGLKIKAPLYRWTSNCPQNYYRGDSMIMRGCARPEYMIHDPSRIGLSRSYKDNYWYRIGNDAIRMTCGFVGSCSLSGYVKGRFYQG
jgi:hypothetical protein